MITASDLPVELHAEILEHLHHYLDGPTLLASALVCKDWCTLSQRILFSAVTDHWHDGPAQRTRSLQTHIRFLQTVAEYPHRLGPLVHSYTQRRMACNLAATKDVLSATKSSYKLWALTEKALPSMINLKHLYLVPDGDHSPACDGWASSRALLKSFTFQLETLSWGSNFDLQNGVPEFLAAQRGLLHLEIGRGPFWMDLSWLQDGVCPRLISGSGDIDSLSHVARSRTIVAWKWSPRWKDIGLKKPIPSALNDLKYLGVYNYMSFRDLIGPMDLKVEILEIMAEGWEMDTFCSLYSRTISSLSNLPNLRVLVLIQQEYATVTTEEMIQGAVDCFQRLPSLQCVILNYSHLHRKGYRYLKVSHLPGSQSREDVVVEELDIHYDVGRLWWTVYDI